MNIKKIICFIIIMCMSFNLMACNKESSKVIYKDGYLNLEGKHIVVYVASRDEVGRTLLEMFKEKTGCTYEYIRMSTQEALERIRCEKKYPKADIFIGGTCDAHNLMKKEQLSEKYICKNYDSIQNVYKDKDGYWTGLEVNLLSIIINKDRWDKEFADKGLEMPEKYEDLLNPMYKDEIIIPDPNISGTGYTIIASIVQNMGKEKAREFLKELKSNVGQFTSNGYIPAQKVATGEYLIGVNFIADQLLVKNSGFNVITNIPKKTGWNIDAISKIKNGPNEDVGKYFIDFCTTKESEETIINISQGKSTRKDVKDDDYEQKCEINMYDNYDFKKASEDREWLIKMWNSFKA
ncbi:ABC transporter substrate-binding protein [Clostridium botulinum]|nr:ABC transporter substrate-binding protein [Clostridium botulinum]NFS96704.1 ABC transporter substrate-binding protein [Clostridium botulinum]